MAASMTVMAAGVGSAAPVKAGLSASSSFGSPLVKLAAPLRPAASKRNVMVVRAALPEHSKTARREMLASLLAAGAVIASAGNSFAASGPGTSGARRTNEKANDLLKAADDLTTKDSPPRFGPGRVGEAADKTGRIAQKGGAGAIESLQDAGGQSIEGAKKAVSSAKSRIDGIFSKKTGDLSDASSVLNDAAGKVSSDVDTAQGKVKSNLSSSKGQTDSLVAGAQSKVESATKDGKGVIGDIVEKIQDAIPQ